MALSEAAERYREQVKMLVVEKLDEVSAFPTGLEEVYGLELQLFMPLLQNPGWFEFHKKGKKAARRRDKKTGEMKEVGKAKEAGERMAETRYKRLDADNRLKFAQDAFIRALGIKGDEQVFRNVIGKNEGDPERVEVRIWVMDPSIVLRRRDG